MRKTAPLSRIILNRTQRESWVAVRITTGGEELERSPEGSYAEAEQYRRTYHEVGAWLKS